jgi:hypothetical protein
MWDERFEIGECQNPEGSYTRVEPLAAQVLYCPEIIAGLNPLQVGFCDRAECQGLVGAFRRKGEKELASVIKEERRVRRILQLVSEQRQYFWRIGFCCAPELVQLARLRLHLGALEPVRLEAVQRDDLGMEVDRRSRLRVSETGCDEESKKQSEGADRKHGGERYLRDQAHPSSRKPGDTRLVMITDCQCFARRVKAF